VPATAPEPSGDTADSTRLDVIANEAPPDEGPQQIDVIATEAPEVGPHTQSEPSRDDRSPVASPARILLALILGVLAGRAARRRRRREKAPAAEDAGDR
jgi:hypothetical protein